MNFPGGLPVGDRDRLLPGRGRHELGIPVLILYMFAQRYIIESVSRSGLKSQSMAQEPAQRMEKEREIKDDDRYIVFYTFEKDEPAPEEADAP